MAAVRARLLRLSRPLRRADRHGSASPKADRAQAAIVQRSRVEVMVRSPYAH
jgi:hypothetical protein